jgi:hypothetical protein
MVEWYFSNLPTKRYVGEQERRAGMKMIKLQFIEALGGTQEQFERVCVAGWNHRDEEVRNRCRGSILMLIKEIPFLMRGDLPDENWKSPMLTPDESRRLVDETIKILTGKMKVKNSLMPETLQERNQRFYGKNREVK